MLEIEKITKSDLDYQKNIISEQGLNQKLRRWVKNQIFDHQYSKHSSRPRINSNIYLLVSINSSHSPIISMNTIFVLQKLHRRLRHQKSSHYLKNLRTNWNHLFASRIFQNSYQILSELIVLSYSLDQLDISSKNLRISSQYPFKQSALKSFSLLENRP